MIKELMFLRDISPEIIEWLFPTIFVNLIRFA